MGTGLPSGPAARPPGRDGGRRRQALHGFRRLFERTFVECRRFRGAPWDNFRVPLPLRPTLEGAREGGASSTPALTDAERSALTVIAEHVRDRVGLHQVWIFAQLPA